MREMSVAEQRYEAVRAVIADGETVMDVGARFGVARKTVPVSALQGELDEWVGEYKTARPHQALDMATPAHRFWREDPAAVAALRPAVSDSRRPAPRRGDGYWVSRRASA